jgi:hypothetical protein
LFVQLFFSFLLLQNFSCLLLEMRSACARRQRLQTLTFSCLEMRLVYGQSYLTLPAATNAFRHQEGLRAYRLLEDCHEALLRKQAYIY